MQVTLNLKSCKALYEDYFKKELPGKMPYKTAAQLVYNAIGKDAFLKRLANLNEGFTIEGDLREA